MNGLDIATILGIIISFALVVYGIIGGDQGVSAIYNFIDMPSVYITIGGTFATMLTMSKSIPDFILSMKTFSLAFKKSKYDISQTINQIITLSNTARKEGLLALEESANNIDEEFLKKGILLIVDGTDPELVRSIMETELDCAASRHKSRIEFWENVASMGPAWGMIGTLLGLVNMLKMLDDAAAIGPNMAIALITTLYGSLLANWLATPVANKLKVNDGLEVMMKEVMVEGILSIQAGENPRVIEEKLKSFLDATQRKSLGAVEEGENVG